MDTLPHQDWNLLQAFFLCICAFLVIVPLNLVSLHLAARLYRDHRPIADLRKMPFHNTVVFIVAVMLVLFAIHMMTNFAWGLFIYFAGVLPQYRESVFYSLENYTSLGLTRVEVGDSWRMLAPMISLSGVFCLGWSTAVLVSLFGQLYSVQPDD